MHDLRNLFLLFAKLGSSYKYIHISQISFIDCSASCISDENMSGVSYFAIRHNTATIETQTQRTELNSEVVGKSNKNSNQTRYMLKTKTTENTTEI